MGETTTSKKAENSESITELTTQRNSDHKDSDKRQPWNSWKISFLAISIFFLLMAFLAIMYIAMKKHDKHQNELAIPL